MPFDYRRYFAVPAGCADDKGGVAVVADEEERVQKEMMMMPIEVSSYQVVCYRSRQSCGLFGDAWLRGQVSDYCCLTFDFQCCLQGAVDS